MEPLALLAAVVGLVWGVVLLRRGGLVAGCLMVLVAAACFGQPFWRSSLGPLPLSIDRLALVVLVAQYLLWRHLSLTKPQPLQTADWLLLGLVGFLTFNTFRADWQVTNYQPVAWLILWYLMPLTVYWVARQTPLGEREGLMVLLFFGVFGTYLAITALAEYYQAWGLVFPKYIVHSAVAGEDEWIGRGRGPLLHPIGNGILLAIALGAALMWWPRLGRAGRLHILIAVVLLGAGLWCSLTRSVWMGGVLTLALLLALVLPRHWRAPLLLGGLVASTLVLALWWENIMIYKRDRHHEASQAAESAQLRPILARIAWEMFLSRPLLGCGYAQYQYEHRNFTGDRTTELPLEKGRGYVQHNVLLAMLTENGLVGLGLFLALLARWGRDAWKLWHGERAPLWARQLGLLFLLALGAYLVNGMFHDVALVPLANMTLFFLAGLTTAARWQVLQPPASSA